MSEENPNPDDNPEEARWYEDLPEELGTDPSIRKFNDVESLAKSYINAQNLIGRDKIPVPNTDDELLAVMRRLGAPDNIEGYEFTDFTPDDGVKLPKVDHNLKDVALEMGMTKKQADRMNTWFYENLQSMAKGTMAQRTATQEATKKAMREQWGDAAQGNVELAKRVLKEYGDDESKEFLEKTGLGNDFNILKVFSKIGSKLVEDRVLEGSTPSGLSPTDLQAQIKKLQANPAYLDKGNPEHKQVVGQVKTLFEQLYPDAA